MKINFNYNKRDIDYVSGYIFKGKSYRCSYVDTGLYMKIIHLVPKMWKCTFSNLKRKFEPLL